jgi:nucleoside-diphosphate-sugar epimerase
MTKVLLTGATGFVGSAVLRGLPSSTRVLGRRHPGIPCEFIAGELTGVTDYSVPLTDVEVVIHCAARAHVMDEETTNPIEIYRQVNTYATLKLARQAAELGVKRFIFISSIKVNGESTSAGKPFNATDSANPHDAYGISKAEAENGLWEIGRETGMAITVIRPPLVYGPGVKANFAALLKIAGKNLPLPLGAIRNARSLVALPNLVEVIIRCIDHPGAINKTFLVSDGIDISTSELLNQMTLAWGKSPRLLPVPVKFLDFCLKLIGKSAISERLFGSLQVDISSTCSQLDWIPQPLLQETLRQCVNKINGDLK